MALSASDAHLFTYGFTASREQLAVIQRELTKFKGQLKHVRPVAYATLGSLSLGLLTSYLPIIPLPFANILLLVGSGAMGLHLYQQVSPKGVSTYGESLETMLQLFDCCLPKDRPASISDYQESVIQDFLLTLAPLLGEQAKQRLSSLCLKQATGSWQDYLQNSAKTAAITTLHTVTFGLFSNGGGESSIAFAKRLSRTLTDNSHTSVVTRHLLGEANLFRKVAPLAEKGHALYEQGVAMMPIK